MILDTAISAKPLNDTQDLTLTHTFSGNFAYLFVQGTLQINQDVAHSWTPTGVIAFANSSPAVAEVHQFQWPMLFSDVWSSSTTPLMLWRSGVDVPARLPIWNAKNAAGVIINVTNQSAAAGAAGTVRSHLCFYEFDLEQVLRYGVNAPIPTYPR